MIDLNNINQQNETANIDPVTSPILPTQPEPTEVQSANSPTVIIPRNNGSVPRWFYFIFGITIIIFFLVTTLLVMQLTQKQQSPKIEAVPTAIPNINQGVILTPTLSPTASDAAILKLNTMGSSDEIVSIEADLKNTDLTVLDNLIEAVDIQIK